jgi:hypothetical protein
MTAMTSFAARFHGLPRPIWIALALVGFIAWWPLGLVIAACWIWSGNMRCCGFGFGDWREETGRQAQDRWVERPESNRAFDDYRADTLRRLEQEQREFREFLSQLRAAKDKAEFDQFMARRRGGVQSAPADRQSA